MTYPIGNSSPLIRLLNPLVMIVGGVLVSRYAVSLGERGQIFIIKFIENTLKAIPVAEDTIENL